VHQLYPSDAATLPSAYAASWLALAGTCSTRTPEPCDRGHPSRRGRKVKESGGKTENPPNMLGLGPLTVNGTEDRLRLSSV
jgi:hypothetical protein